MQYRTMTPGEEEIMRIYEDGIYRPPDMIERSRDIIVLIYRSHQETLGITLGAAPVIK